MQFLIQSDFITTSNRQDRAECSWNDALLDGIALAIKDAVLQFCEDASLQFNWIRYLPGESVSDKWWAQLRQKILSIHKQTSILRPRSGGNLRLPSQLKWFSPSFCDETGEPLFEDLADEMYLSSQYLWADKKFLDQLGVLIMHFGDVVARVQADLDKPSSRMRSNSTSSTWHASSANLLMILFDELPYDESWLRHTKEIEDLKLVPLQGGSWTSSKGGRVYYPYTNSVSIPTDLGLQLLEPTAGENAARRKLFSKLGVKNCEPEEVRRKIRLKYSKPGIVDLQSSIMHLRYLYWNPDPDESSSRDFMYLMDQHENPVYHKFVTLGRTDLIVDDLYFDTDDEYGARKLSARVFGGQAFEIHYLNRAYRCAAIPDKRREDLAWEEWLEKIAKVRRSPRLCTTALPKTLSPCFRFIVEYRVSETVGTLKAHWSAYKSLMGPENPNPDIERELGAAEV